MTRAGASAADCAAGLVLVATAVRRGARLEVDDGLQGVHKPEQLERIKELSAELDELWEGLDELADSDPAAFADRVARLNDIMREMDLVWSVRGDEL